MVIITIDTENHSKEIIPIIIQISGLQKWLIIKLLPITLNIWLQPCKVPIYLLLLTQSQIQTIKYCYFSHITVSLE